MYYPSYKPPHKHCEEVLTDKTMNILQLPCVLKCSLLLPLALLWENMQYNIFCQIPNVFIRQHKYTVRDILYSVTHIWNSDLAKNWSSSSNGLRCSTLCNKMDCFILTMFLMNHDAWCESTVCSFLLVWFKNMSCHFQSGNCTIRIKVGTENQKV